jgi:hypothetical protein
VKVQTPQEREQMSRQISVRMKVTKAIEQWLGAHPKGCGPELVAWLKAQEGVRSASFDQNVSYTFDDGTGGMVGCGNGY